jgi:transposase
LRDLHRQLGRALIVVMDRLPAHRSAARQLQKAGATWLTVGWLPGYAPDLNPVEAHWSTSKYSRLANYVPNHIDDLYDAVTEAVGDAAFDQTLLRSYFQSAHLRL